MTLDYPLWFDIAVGAALAAALYAIALYMGKRAVGRLEAQRATTLALIDRLEKAAYERGRRDAVDQILADAEAERQARAYR